MWEVELACNLACSHCGSRAGQPRARELSTPEALDLVEQLADNIGYHGPFAGLLAVAGASAAIGEGCAAGVSVLGIEADGTIKGCPSLPARVYGGGNVREKRLRDMLSESEALSLNVRARLAPREHLWGSCRTCDFAASCRGGCTWTAHAFVNRPGNNPHCHHRTLEMARRGRRERLVQVERAPGLPFDSGLFELVEEPLDAPSPADDDRLRFTMDRVRWPAGWQD